MLTSHGKNRAARPGWPFWKNWLASAVSGTSVAELVALGGLLRTKPGNSAASSTRSAMRSARRAHGPATTNVARRATGLSTAGGGGTRPYTPAAVAPKLEHRERG